MRHTGPPPAAWPTVARGLTALGLAAAMVAGPVVLAPGPVVLAPAAATGGQCVALVVDRAPGSYSTRCVSWSAGMTGLDVLRRAGHSVQFRYDGLICKIDGYPGGACQADVTHYWSYWHRAPGSSAWSYSNAGAASYQPAVSAAEGWAYQDGTSRQPANVAFRTICPPPSTPPRTTTAPRPPPPPATAPTTRRATTTAPARAGAPAPGPADAPPSTARRAHQATTGAAPATTRAAVSTTPAAAVAGPSSTAPATTAVAPASGGSPVALIAGLALAGVIGGAGLWLARSRRGTA